MVASSLVGNALQLANSTPSSEERQQAANPSGTNPEWQRPMQDNENQLLEGCEWDPISQVYFYINNTANPPRSAWAHPYEDRLWLESPGYTIDAPDSESNKDKVTLAEKTRTSVPGTSSTSPIEANGTQVSGSRLAQFHNDQFSFVLQPGETSFQKRRAGGVVRGVATEFLNDRRHEARRSRSMQDLSAQRRTMLQKNGCCLPATMAGPLFGGHPATYALPPVPYAGRGARRDMHRTVKPEANDHLVNTIVQGRPAPVAQGKPSPYSHASGRLMY